jgi:sugar diacid utilization regulator
MARPATVSKSEPMLPDSLLAELERRRAGLARHMTRAVVTEVRWDDSTGVPPEPSAIARACEAGLDLFLATARESRPPTPEELRRVAQLGILQARGSQSVEPVLAAYRIAARVAWDAILRAWRAHPEATPEAIVVSADYVFRALDQVAAQVTRTFLEAREHHLQRGTRARGRLVHALLSDTFDSELSLRKQALGLNLALATAYVAVVFKTDRARGADALLEVATGIETAAKALTHALDSQTLVLLCPVESDDALELAQRAAEEVRREAEQRWGRGRGRVRAGVGGHHPGLAGTSRSYLEAQQALEYGRRVRPEEAVHHYADLVPYIVLAQNPLLIEAYIRRHLGRLLAADAEGRMPLLQTLEAFLRHGSVKDAAAALRLHRHTVIYRLEKVGELLELRLDEPRDRLRLQLALDLRRAL